MSEHTHPDGGVDANCQFYHHDTVSDNRHMIGTIANNALQAMPAYADASYDKIKFVNLVTCANDYVRFLILQDSNIIPPRPKSMQDEPKNADVVRQAANRARFATTPLAQQTLLSRLKAETFTALCDPKAYVAASKARANVPPR